MIERLDTVRVNKQGIPIEVALTQDMHHLGVARCLAWGIGQPDPELAKLSPAAATPTCWMVQEYCDKHTLVVSSTAPAVLCRRSRAFTCLYKSIHFVALHCCVGSAAL